MNTTIRGHNLRVTRIIAMLAVLLVLSVALVFVLRPAPTTSDPATSTGGKGGCEKCMADPLTRTPP